MEQLTTQEVDVLLENALKQATSEEEFMDNIRAAMRVIFAWDPECTCTPTYSYGEKGMGEYFHIHFGRCRKHDDTV